MEYNVIDTENLLQTSPEELVNKVDDMLFDAIYRFCGDEEDLNDFKNTRTAVVSGFHDYSRPEGNFINVEVTDTDGGDVDFGYIRMEDDLNGFISKGNPRIFSVSSPAARTETVTVEIQPLDDGDMADLEEMYEGFSDENKPDKEAWMSGYKLSIR